MDKLHQRSRTSTGLSLSSIPKEIHILPLLNTHIYYVSQVLLKIIATQKSNIPLMKNRATLFMGKCQISSVVHKCSEDPMNKMTVILLR